MDAPVLGQAADQVISKLPRLRRIPSFGEAETDLIRWQTKIPCRHSESAFAFDVKVDGVGYVTVQSLVCSDLFLVPRLRHVVVDELEVLRLSARLHAIL